MNNTKDKRELAILNQQWFQILGIFLLFVGMIVISNKITDMGNGYWGVGTIVFVLCYLLFPIALQQICGRILKNRLSKEQYQNVLSGLRFLMIFGLVLGLLLGGCLWVLSPIMANLLQAKLSAMVLQVYTVVIFLACILAVLRGVLMVTKSNSFVQLSFYIEAVAAFAAMLGLSKWWIGYGKKVSVILQNDQVQYGYNGCVVPLGLCFGMIVAIIYLSVFWIANTHFWKTKVKKETSRYRENKKNLLRRILLSFPEEWSKQLVFAPMFFVFFAILISQKRLVTNELPYTSIYYMGSFFGKLCIIEIIVFYAVRLWLKQWKNIVKPVFIQGDKKSIRVYLTDGLKLLLLVGLGFSVMLEVFSPWVVRLLFLGDQAAALKIFRLGSFSVLFLMLYMYFSQVLSYLKRRKMNQMIDALGFIVGILFHLCFAGKGISILGMSITVFFMVSSLVKWYFVWRIMNIPLAIDLSVISNLSKLVKLKK